MQKITDGLYVVDDCGINLERLKASCDLIFKDLKDFKPIDNVDRMYRQNTGAGKGDAPVTTQLNGFYNFFTYPFPEVHKLFKIIQQKFYELEETHYGRTISQNHFFNAWLNYYNHGEYVDWHSHQQNKPWSWHGFFCVDTEPSVTSYQFAHKSDIIDVPSKDNRLVFSLCENNVHKTDPWPYTDRPRITIAFDVVLEQFIEIKRNISIPF